MVQSAFAVLTEISNLSSAIKSINASDAGESDFSKFEIMRLVLTGSALRLKDVIFDICYFALISRADRLVGFHVDFFV